MLENKLAECKQKRATRKKRLHDQLTSLLLKKRFIRQGFASYSNGTCPHQEIINRNQKQELVLASQSISMNADGT